MNKRNQISVLLGNISRTLAKESFHFLSALESRIQTTPLAPLWIYQHKTASKLALPFFLLPQEILPMISASLFTQQQRSLGSGRKSTPLGSCVQAQYSSQLCGFLTEAAWAGGDLICALFPEPLISWSTSPVDQLKGRTCALVFQLFMAGGRACDFRAGPKRAWKKRGEGGLGRDAPKFKRRFHQKHPFDYGPGFCTSN